jgi:outer membrane receptor protein involved in Fe transport
MLKAHLSRGTALASSTLLIAIGFATSAAAQVTDVSSQPDSAAPDATSKQQEIIVTGSRIARPSYDNPQPTTTINAASINARGYTDIGRALSDLPGFAVPDSSMIGGQGNGFGVGQTFVNLYNLGSQRTLTLVNGRRFVGANPATIFSSAEGGTQVDLNTIPTQLIERVETVSIGGAPIYGSDAIAGTVNIILKHDYQGFDFDAQNGISQQGDLHNYRFRALVGQNFAGGRGNVTLDVEYNKDSGLLGTDRAVIAAQYGFVQPSDPDSPYSLVLARNTRTFLGSPGGLPYIIDRTALDANTGTSRAVRGADGTYYQFGAGGNLIPYNIGTPTPDFTTFIGGDALDNATITNLRVNDWRINSTLLAHFDVTDHIQLYGEGWFSRSKATNLRDQPVYNTEAFSQNGPGVFDINGNYIFHLDNPFLTSQARSIISAAIDRGIAQGLLPAGDDTFYVGRENTDLTTGTATSKQTLYRIVGGLKGDFDFLKNNWKWDVSGNYGRTRSVSVSPTIVESNLRRALNVTTDANGNIVCAPFNPDPADPTAPPNTPQYDGTISTTCAPLDLFGNGSPSQAARDYVTTMAKIVSITSQRDILATVGGSLFNLPGGPLGVSFGYENRREYSRFSPDAFYTGGLGRSIPILGVSGSYTTNELFGEFRAPLIGPDQHIPLVHSLEFNGAGRYVHNTISGNAFTWTAGGRWAPIQDIAFRGNYTRAIRSPSVTEAFAANQPAFDGGYDPCDQSRLGSGPNPATRQANCASIGLPADFVSNINTVTEPITVTGNRNLKNEYSKSWTVGTVIEPRFAHGLSIAVDYINIHLHDAITASSAQDVLTACYDSTSFPNSPFCADIQRDLTGTPATNENFGQVLSLEEPYINQGGRVFKAIEVSANYPINLPSNLGRLTIGVTYQHLIKDYTIISADAGATINRGAIGDSIDRGNLELTYDKGSFTWYNQIRYVGPALQDPNEPAGTRDIPGVGKWAVWNTSVSYQINDQFSVRVNVDNVTNRNLPFPYTGVGLLNTYYEGLIGRSFLVGAGVHF